MHTVIIAASSYPQVPRAQKHLFPYVHAPTLALTIFLPLFCKGSYPGLPCHSSSKGKLSLYYSSNLTEFPQSDSLWLYMGRAFGLFRCQFITLCQHLNVSNFSLLFVSPDIFTGWRSQGVRMFASFCLPLSVHRNYSSLHGFLFWLIMASKFLPHWSVLRICLLWLWWTIWHAYNTLCVTFSTTGLNLLSSDSWRCSAASSFHHLLGSVSFRTWFWSLYSLWNELLYSGSF